MPYQNQVVAPNVVGNFFAGRQAAQEDAVQGLQMQRAQRLNALAGNPAATPDQYVRAGDPQTGMALQTMNQQGQVDKLQAVQQMVGIAQKALTITDPVQRKSFLQQAGQIYAPSFQALGADMSQFPAMLQMPDDQLDQRLKQVAQLAAPQKPIEVAPGGTLAVQDPTNPGKYTTAFSNPKDNEITPYQKQQLQIERDRLNFEKTKPTGNSIPSGYEQDPNNPGALRPIKGGPHDPDSTSSGMDSRSSVMFNRVAASAQAATKAIQNIMELPVSTSSGWFGTAEPGHGLMDSVKGVLSQKVTGQEAQDFKTMVAGVSRNLSTIETAGLAPNGAITNSMNAVLLGEGDTQMTKLRKMAEMRQIVEENLKPQLANPKLAPAQKQLVRDIIGSVQQAVPFTHHDITLLQSSKNPQATIKDFATQQGLPAATQGDAVQTATGPNGQKLYLRNGQWVSQ